MQPLRGPTSGYGGQVFLVFGEDGPSKWGLDLIDQWQKGMILEVFAKMAMASFVLVIPYTPLPFPCAAHLLSLDGSSRGDIDKLALDPAPTSKPMLYFF
ncbi:hypothetical protein CK203_002890 [Vitis vinifera]|uniref:Uncharacterized protein n=1 Tax=Vitis vinifera TaxID=29760 RepID=A0A438KGZ3_VITVI|nr:hypothetical protein CK203_002890 [Vitis vinifera]